MKAIEFGGKVYRYDCEEGNTLMDVVDEMYSEVSTKKIEKMFKDVDLLKNSAIENICTRNQITSSRERKWAEWAVIRIGFSDYKVPDYTPFRRLRLTLWESKADHFISVQRALHHNNFKLAKELDEKYRLEHEELTAKIMAHVLIHGNEVEDYVLSNGSQLPVGIPGQILTYNPNPTWKDFQDLIKKI